MGLKHYLTAWCSHGTEFVSALCFAALLGLAKGVNVALHAQVPPDSGVVVGSAVTMAGLQRAFEMFSESSHARNTSGGLEIAQVEVFYPFNYVGLHDRQWDLVIIEGWFKMINAFIHEVSSGSSYEREHFLSTYSKADVLGTSYVRHYLLPYPVFHGDPLGVCVRRTSRC